MSEDMSEPLPGRLELADMTTIGLGGPAPAVYTAHSAVDVAEMVGELDCASGALVVGGGSNLVVSDIGVDIPVVRVAIPGLTINTGYDGVHGSAHDVATVAIGAGENWDAVAEQLVAEGWCGVETLSGIPGCVGATPVQNVGAYGTEIADVLVDVDVYDRGTGVVRTMLAAELALGYRTSMLRGTDRGVVTAVRLGLSKTPRPVRYRELAQLLGIAVGDAAPPAPVREAVLELRRGKGMVLDSTDLDTRSVGSFFTNPIVPDAELAAVAAAVATRLNAERPGTGRPGTERPGTHTSFPHYPAGPGQTKLSAAWLIERAGFCRGYPRMTVSGRGARPDARISISTKHTLALTNRGGGTTAELVALAREVRDGVRAAFGVTLLPEPVLVGVSLDEPAA